MPGALQRGEREDLGGMRPVFGIERDHQQLRAQHAGERAVDPEIHDLLAIQAALLREARGHPERDKKGEGDQHAVSGQAEKLPI